MQEELEKSEEAFREALNIAKQMANGQEKVADVQWWLDHLEETRDNGGVCGCGTTEADESESARSPEDTTSSPVEIEDRMEVLTTSESLGTDTSSNGLPSVQAESALSPARPPLKKSFFESMKKRFGKKRRT
ncbi:hypothetical protein LTR24_007185 [Lithohypha guttulata]|uniref:Uncharacterized protein n=1 Tax=Lithohypha guttulata TaxID=1690604 RepID=A0ABR0K3U5_9EURO|nr:hypothetical protein LTR24_007185 [Lithohypha guttulata]